MEDLVGDLDHVTNARSLFEVDHRAHVQAADRGVAVVAAVRIVLAQDLSEAAQEPRHLLERHRRVFDKGDRLVIAL